MTVPEKPKPKAFDLLAAVAASRTKGKRYGQASFRFCSGPIGKPYHIADDSYEESSGESFARWQMERERENRR